MVLNTPIVWCKKQKKKTEYILGYLDGILECCFFFTIGIRILRIRTYPNYCETHHESNTIGLGAIAGELCHLYGDGRSILY